ncbi:MAG: cation:H+ antiporter [Candidatus Woesearchaeota archaeon]|jgi:cation:H+ antiporter
MELFLWICVFIVSFAVLIKSSDWFVDYASRVGKSMHLSDFVIGVTIVALGTSLPELVTAIVAVFDGALYFPAGTVVGSNIANFGIILGLCGVLVHAKHSRKITMTGVDFPAILISVLLLVLVSLDGRVTFTEGIFLILSYVVYMLYHSKEHNKQTKVQNEKFQGLHLVYILLSCVGIYLGSVYAITSVEELTVLFGMSDTSVIAMTLVALGTSLPELSVSFQALRKGKLNLVLGNVIGSNIFNTFMVLGIPALFATHFFSSLTVTLAIPTCILLTFLLYIFIKRDKTIARWEAVVLLIVYILFIILAL